MSDQEIGTLIHQGTLIKSPPESKSKDLGRWRKRYFKLWSSKKLEYFKNGKSEKPLKKPIDLSRCKSIDGGLQNKKWDYIFCINTDYRKYYLVAKTHQSMNDWIEKICEICGFSEQVGMSPIESSPTSMSFFDSPLIGKRRFAADVPTEGGALPLGSQDITGAVPIDVLSYDKELPPLPDSSSSSDFDSREDETNSPQPTFGSPFGIHVKQSKSDSPCGSCYDMVPKPRLAPEGLPLRSSPPESRLFTATESALKNMTIKDESYVDMKADNGNQDTLTHNHVNDVRCQQSSYDTVPVPRPIVQANFSNYDLVPKPRRKSDEYISCDISERDFKGDGAEDRETAPPVPDQTYNGFDTLPNERRLLQKPTRSSEWGTKKYGQLSMQGTGDEIYDVPPTEGSLSQMIYDTPPAFKSARDYEAQSCGDSIYDTPPTVEIQDDPPFQSPNGLQNRGYLSDSLYDIPPPFKDREQTDDSIYDIPPRSPEENDNSIYDIPPKSQEQDAQDSLYDLPPRSGISNEVEPISSPADLFNFGFNVPPKVDRSLKYSSTGDLERNRSIPPPVDRKTRPVLTASVPAFPSEVEESHLTDTFSDLRSEMQLDSDSIYDCPPRSALGVPPSNIEGKSPDRPSLQNSSTNYSSVDPRLTAAIQNVRR